jgi:hypothetical protein
VGCWEGASKACSEAADEGENLAELLVGAEGEYLVDTRNDDEAKPN